MCFQRLNFGLNYAWLYYVTRINRCVIQNFTYWSAMLFINLEPLYVLQLRIAQRMVINCLQLKSRLEKENCVKLTLNNNRVQF